MDSTLKTSSERGWLFCVPLQMSSSQHPNLMLLTDGTGVYCLLNPQAGGLLWGCFFKLGQMSILANYDFFCV